MAINFLFTSYLMTCHHKKCSSGSLRFALFSGKATAFSVATSCCHGDEIRHRRKQEGSHVSQDLHSATRQCEVSCHSLPPPPFSYLSLMECVTVIQYSSLYSLSRFDLCRTITTLSVPLCLFVCLSLSVCLSQSFFLILSPVLKYTIDIQIMTTALLKQFKAHSYEGGLKSKFRFVITFLFFIVHT